ncbi:LysR family transcriptional regulator [Dyella dinghuensis]|uniref:LysR family transcriptional regulator n=1 Tax=Dyella dinghuensis TaxID=1920169 RepID=A0A3S0QY89_9GAMM|nr:LysR family transcriptional regulator [Dyella dinghuensis]RUL65750.1 LysR family transcriptional regulator [Dyella dinghuensis]
MTDELSDLRLFVRIVAAGSLSEAARRLHSSLPSMSRRLMAMEERLGVRLIDRGTRHFKLTEEGSLLYERGIAILNDLDDLTSQVSASIAIPQGHIRVGAPMEIGRRRFGPLIADFTRKYPRVSVELALTDSPIDVLGSDLDIGVLWNKPTDGSMVVRLLLASRGVICASPEYLAAHGTPEKPDDLLSHECILLMFGRHVYDRWPFQEDGKEREIQVHGSLCCDNTEVVRGWALAGCGVATRALWDIEEDLAEGRLIELLKPYSCDEINLYIAYPTRAHLPPRVRVFIDFLVERISGSP